ncbi:MAG: pilus assembly protein PilP [Smithellaceae bacterium]
MKKITFITLIIVFAVFLKTASILAGEAPKTTMPALPAKGVPAKQPVPEAQPLAPAVQIPQSTYSYNPAGKPDPFQPFVDAETALKKKAEKKGVGSIYPLQRTEVDQFRLVGIAGDQNRRIAMVEDGTKKYYPLSVGTHIGVNKGKVVEILPDRVIVEEYKTKKAKRIILKLHKNQDEVKP